MGSSHRLRTNLAPTPALIGRAIDRAALASVLDEGARLVTIVGPGGMGKTSLAIAFARERAEAWSEDGDSGGVWFCDLTSAASAADLCATIAAALGTRLRATSDPAMLAEHVGRALDRRGRTLLVLDNFEQLVPAATRTVATLLHAAPHTRILVTSRLALGLPNEYRWPLRGLEEPPPAEAHPTAEALRGVESVDLFVRRARQVRPDFVVDDEAVRAIASIATQLEGIPLAIELAAARVGVLSTAQIRDRLAARSEDILKSRNDEGRHGSMRSVVMDSFRLLGAREQECLLGCAVFRGGFTLAAADAVLVADGTSALEPIDALVAHSLLRATNGPDADEPRFALYEVVRELAESELDARPELRATFLRRHAALYATLAGKAAGDELDNLLRAHETLVAGDGASGDRREDVERALALATAIDPILVGRGLLALRLDLAERTLAFARAEDAETSSLFARILLARGHAHAELGAFEPAMRDLEEALARARDARTTSRVHVQLGAIIEARGDTAAACAQFEAALACGGDGIEAAEARAALAHAYRREGRLDDATELVSANIAAYRSLGDDRGLARMLHEAGVHALFRQQHTEAVARFDEAFGIAERAGIRQQQAATHTARGTLEQERGDLASARALHERAVAIFRDLSMPYSEASTLYYLAGAHFESGQLDDAEAVFTTALRLVRTVGVPRYEALILGALAALRAQRGAVAEAAALLEQADAIARACQSEPTLLATLAVHRAGLDAGRGPSVLASARSLAERYACDDPRFAFRILERAVKPHGAPLAALVVRESGRAFRLPDTESDVDLGRRAPLARILGLLAQRRIDAPGDGLRVDDLLAAGWPGERVRYDAGSNRVYVALAELRKLGLRDWLISDDRGYRLTTSQPVVFESTSGRDDRPA